MMSKLNQCLIAETTMYFPLYWQLLCLTIHLIALVNKGKKGSSYAVHGNGALLI